MTYYDKTDKELRKIAEEKSVKVLGRLSPAYVMGYIKGYKDEMKHHNT